MSRQLALNIENILPPEAYEYGVRSSGESHGVVLTKPHVVDLILDLAGYTPDLDLAGLCFLEPACGLGAFLLPAVDRLARSAERTGRKIEDCTHAIRAYEIEPEHVARTRDMVSAALIRSGVGAGDANRLSVEWVRQGDYLLSSEDETYDVIVGNPPYVRIEQLSPSLQRTYRNQFSTLFDRADLYVAFIEKSLRLLSSSGVLSFICADRWILNKYGAPLRRMITRDYHVAAYVDLHTASPFESEVVAYPSIFVVSASSCGGTSVAKLASGSVEECQLLGRRLRDGPGRRNGVRIDEYDSWFSDDEPWVISSPEHLRVLRELEARHQPIELHGDTKVRIGIATGIDSVYIVGEEVDVEEDRRVPLVMRADVVLGSIRNGHQYVLNTFEDDGRVVDLSRYPRLRSYLLSHEPSIRRRHVAAKNPGSWFRTIDRLHRELVNAPKLLIPDIAGANEVAYEPGQYYPHHNLYFITSTTWDLEILGGLLGSKVALFFVWSYAVKMRGSYLRFQAQYLRRICLPDLETLPESVGMAIREAFRLRRFDELDDLALQAYGIRALPEFEYVDTRA